MAKVGIITFLHNENYGSSLQAYALQSAVREAGHDCEHIDYMPDRKEKIRNLLCSGNDLKLIAEGLRKRSVRSAQQGAREKSGAIPAFYRERMKLGPACRNRAELRKQAEKYDILVCGSDQVWNPVWLNPAYFLTFAPEGTRKVAYAASLGIRTMPAARKVRKIRKWTEGFSAISVREEEGAELLEKMTGLKADVMPDPVCLLSREEWEEVAVPCGEGPYLLCYFIGENESYWEKVRKLSAESGLPVRVKLRERIRTAGRHRAGALPRRDPERVAFLHRQFPRPGVRHDLRHEDRGDPPVPGGRPGKQKQPRGPFPAAEGRKGTGPDPGRGKGMAGKAAEGIRKARLLHNRRDAFRSGAQAS